MVDINHSPIPPEVKITLDGKERTLKYPITAIWAFEDLSGVQISRGVDKEEDFYGPTLRTRMTRIIQMLWAGLITDDPGITYDYVSRFVYPRNLKEIDEKVARAFMASLPEGVVENEKDPLATSGQQVN